MPPAADAVLAAAVRATRRHRGETSPPAAVTGSAPPAGVRASGPGTGRRDRERPVRGAVQRGGQGGAVIAAGGVELGLVQEEAAGSGRPRAGRPRAGPRRSGRPRRGPRRAGRRRSGRRRAGSPRPGPARRRSTPISTAPRRSAPGWPARARSPARESSALTRPRCASTSRASSSSGVPSVSRPVSSSAAARGRRAADRAGSGRAPRSGTRAARAAAASPRRCRTSARAVAGSARQSRPPKVTWATCWPAPKQSKTVQPGKPRCRRSRWMPQRESAPRFGQGCPAGLSSAKSAEAAKAGATQQMPEATGAVGAQLPPADGRRRLLFRGVRHVEPASRRSELLRVPAARWPRPDPFSAHPPVAVPAARARRLVVALVRPRRHP